MYKRKYIEKINLKMRNRIKKNYNKKDRRKFFYLKHLRKVAKRRVRNEELYKIPKFINYYFSLKM